MNVHCLVFGYYGYKNKEARLGSNKVKMAAFKSLIDVCREVIDEFEKFVRSKLNPENDFYAFAAMRYFGPKIVVQLFVDDERKFFSTARVENFNEMLFFYHFLVNISRMLIQWDMMEVFDAEDLCYKIFENAGIDHVDLPIFR